MAASARTSPSVVRLRISCPSRAEYQARLAGEYELNGIFIPSGRIQPRPIGTRVHLKIELADRTLGFAGAAVVVAHVNEKARVGYLLQLEGGGEPALTPCPTPRPTAGAVPLPAPAPALTPPIAPEAAFAVVPPPAAFADPPPPGLPEPPALGDILFGEDERTPPPIAPRAVTEELSLEGVQGAAPARSAASAADPDETRPVAVPPALEDAPAPEPTPALTQLPAPRAASRRRLALGAAALAIVLGGAAVGALVAARRGEAADSAFTLSIAMADDRIRAGRLAAPAGDSALDHLAAARAVRPDDARLTARAKVLADTFEALGARAMGRGDLQEAGAHFAGALRADPARDSARRQLETLARLEPKRREAPP